MTLENKEIKTEQNKKMSENPKNPESSEITYDSLVIIEHEDFALETSDLITKEDIETKFDVAGWFETLWATYEVKYCGNGAKKGPKSKAFERVKIKIRTQEKADEVMSALREQIIYYKKAQKKGEWQPNFPMLITWLNQERWTIEIDSHGELEERTKLKKCLNCDNEIHGPNYNLCADCIAEQEFKKSNSRLSMIDAYRTLKLSMQPGESQTEYRERMIRITKSCTKKMFGKI